MSLPQRNLRCFALDHQRIYILALKFCIIYIYALSVCAVLCILAFLIQVIHKFQFLQLVAEIFIKHSTLLFSISNTMLLPDNGKTNKFREIHQQKQHYCTSTKEPKCILLILVINFFTVMHWNWAAGQTIYGGQALQRAITNSVAEIEKTQFPSPDFSSYIYLNSTMNLRQTNQNILM